MAKGHIFSLVLITLPIMDVSCKRDTIYVLQIITVQIIITNGVFVAEGKSITKPYNIFGNIHNVILQQIIVQCVCFPPSKNTNLRFNFFNQFCHFFSKSQTL